jgi:hypothetical protein
MSKKWYWCDIHYACFGFSIQNNKICDVPPIFKWAKGKNVKVIKPFLLKRKAKVIKL